MTRQSVVGNCCAGPGKLERYIKPSILMSLRKKPSYGYEINQTIQEYGFVERNAPPDMIYRYLRDFESAGLVVSSWQKGDGGPGKKIYGLTPEGKEALSLWVEHMQDQALKLTNFIKAYRKIGKRG